MSKKKFQEKKSKKEKEQKSSIHKTVVTLLNESPGKAFDFKQIARKVGAKNKLANKEIFDTLDSLIEEGRIRQLSSGGYASIKKSQSLTGTSYGNRGAERYLYQIARPWCGYSWR